MPLAAPVTRAAGMPPRLPACALRQTCQPLVPVRADLGHPAHRVHQRRGRERVARLAALAARLDEPGALQRREVLGDGLAGDRQLAGEPRGGQLRPLRRPSAGPRGASGRRARRRPRLRRAQRCDARASAMQLRAPRDRVGRVAVLGDEEAGAAGMRPRAPTRRASRPSGRRSARARRPPRRRPRGRSTRSGASSSASNSTSSPSQPSSSDGSVISSHARSRGTGRTTSRFTTGIGGSCN